MRTRRSSARRASTPDGLDGRGSGAIEALPDAVLGRVLALVWDVNNSGVANPALVSRRWRRVFFSEPGIWRHTSTVLPNHSGPAGLAVEQRMLQRVAPLVHSLVATQREGPEGLSPAAGEQLAATLRVLRAALVARLDLDWSEGGLTPEVFSAGCLGRLSGLTELSLRSVRLPDEAAEAVHRLTTLRDLAVEARSIAYELLSGLSALTQLTRLHLGSGQLLSLSPLTHLSALHRLRQLSLVEDSEEFAGVPWGVIQELEGLQHQQWLAARQRLGPLRLPPLAAFPDLQLFHFFNSCRQARRGVQARPQRAWWAG
ncbi:hypothetical protein ABPG75_009084 [Micractinium tetrahymenae]